MLYSDIAPLASEIRAEISKAVIGHQREIALLTCCLICGGHVLIEDVPGTGKTTLARTLAAAVDGKFARVQFTPDLLPADITGMTVYRPETGGFEFLRGPVFANILLADEVNRATPRTQSALLECMAEGQVTENGVTYVLPKPFFVIATENPVETQGTFPLPEAQLDRFLMRLSFGVLDRAESVEMLTRYLHMEPMTEVRKAADAKALTLAAELASACTVSEDMMAYMAALVEKLRDPAVVRLGPSPRALLMLMRACQAWSAQNGRDYVIPDDVKALAVPVLAHRIILRGWEEGASCERWVTEALASVPVPTEART